MNTRDLELQIDISAIIKNYNYFNILSGNAKVGSVVKADCYGLGATKIVPKLYDAGCRDFFVARMGEALELKDLVGDAKIYIFDGLLSAEDLELCHTYGFIPILNTVEQIKIYNAHPCPAALHFDTGMNRLGLNVGDLDSLQHFETIELILSHLACADDKDHPMTAEQFARFQTFFAQFPNAERSFCNTAASLENSNMHCDLLRVGIGLYGGCNRLPVVQLHAPVLQIRHIKAGETIGYDATYCADSNIDVATIGIGYADGYFRSLSNRGYVYFNGQSCPVIGRVSMDYITIDISGLKDKPKINSRVEILGSQQNIDQLAKDAKTIGYEVLTTLGKTLKKCYL